MTNGMQIVATVLSWFFGLGALFSVAAHVYFKLSAFGAEGMPEGFRVDSRYHRWKPKRPEAQHYLRISYICLLAFVVLLAAYGGVRAWVMSNE